MNVFVLMPAYNEEERIAATVTAVRSVRMTRSVLVIDDGSTDATADRARAAGAHVIVMRQNSGKGAALDAGLAHLRTLGDLDAVLLLDADLGKTASQVSALLDPVIEGEADMTIATFPAPKSRAGFGLVMRLARDGIKRLGNPDFDALAPLSGQRALNTKAISICTPFATGFGVEVALTVRALRAGLRVSEVPTTMAHAATGRDIAGFLHRGRQYVDVRKTLKMLERESLTADRKPTPR